MRMHKQSKIYKPVSWLVSINAYQWKSAYCYLDSSHLENLLKYIFRMGVNTKFDFRRVWKFCWDLSNVMSGGNWLFRRDCVFSGGTLYPSANYGYKIGTLARNEVNYELNSFMTEVPIILKPVHWFALQINRLVSIW